jgi:hypothetical protein
MAGEGGCRHPHLLLQHGIFRSRVGSGCAVPTRRENGLEMRVVGQKSPKSVANGIKSVADRVKSVTDLIKSATDLIKLKTDLTESEADLTKSQTDLIKSKLDLTQSEADLIKSETDLIKSASDLTKSVTDLIKSETKLIQSETDFIQKMVKNRHFMIKNRRFMPKWLKMGQYDGSNGSLALTMKTSMENGGWKMAGEVGTERELSQLAAGGRARNGSDDFNAGWPGEPAAV